MLLALTMLAGVVDATSILALDNVFVATITGNIVFLGLGLAGASAFSVLSPAVALGGFVIGVPICRRWRTHRGRAPRWRSVSRSSWPSSWPAIWCHATKRPGRRRDDPDQGAKKNAA
jgi:uncharacterized membrane protein YoaK (UPF0700 family)